ncbi:MAG TPA: OsmC family protein [Ktedonobacterales bacterium]|jgi:organic hydroperoxide reductase OsmC/OhrA
MAQLTVHVRTVHEAPTAVGWAGNRTLTIDRPEQARGMGLGYSGGELLFLSIGACYCNDIYREAAKRGIVVKSVQVEVSGDWGGEPVRAQNVTFSAKVEAEASEAEIQALMEHTDRVAEIPNSLRMGTPVQLSTVQAVSLPRKPQE